MFDLSRPRRILPDDHPAFARLDVRHVLLADARTRAAVHLRGNFRPGRVPLVCLAGYQRNMSDFSSFAGFLQHVRPGNWPMVLVDLPGRGRSDDRPVGEDYGTPSDARDLADILAALGIGRAIFFGQGYGGQVAMALAAARPLLVGGAILLDAGPVTDPRSIVRLRTNLMNLEMLRGGKATVSGFRRVLLNDYPGLPERMLDALALRTYWFDKRGWPQPLFDRRLVERLKGFSFDDVLVPQWPLFDALRNAPLMLMRTQRTDQLHRATVEEMLRRRPDATTLAIPGQGSPALLDQREEAEAIAAFVLLANERWFGKAA